MINPVLKGLYYQFIPLPVAQLLVPKIFSENTPFKTEIDKTEVIFVHIPKAAGSSIKTEIYGQPKFGHRRILDYAIYSQQKCDSYFKFSFVRNPWDRMLSAFSYLYQGVGTKGRDNQFAKEFLHSKKDFHEFMLGLENIRYRKAVIRYDHFRPQVHWICMPGNRAHIMDFVGRFESMEDDMEIIRQRLGLVKKETVARVRPSKHVPYREAYTDRTRAILADIYAEDIDLLSYSF